MLFAVSSSDEGGAITDIVLTPLASLTPLALTPADAACATDFVPTSLISSTASFVICVSLRVDSESSPSTYLSV